jgi:hypothetical protein
MDYSAEYVEPMASNGIQVDSVPQNHSLLESSLPIASLLHRSLAGSPIMESDRGPVYPEEAIESSQDSLALKDFPSEDLDKPTSLELAPSDDSPLEETIQPIKFFQAATEMRENRSTLEHILSAPVSLEEPEPKKAGVSPNSAMDDLKPDSDPEDKVRRYDIPTSDATLAEVMRAALVDASNANQNLDLTMHHDTVPDGKPSPSSLRQLEPDSIVPTVRSDLDFADSSPAPEFSGDAATQRMAIEVIQALRSQGYILKKDPGLPSPKPNSSGSAINNQSRNPLSCEKCGKTTWRPSELK